MQHKVTGSPPRIPNIETDDGVSWQVAERLRVCLGAWDASCCVVRDRFVAARSCVLSVYLCVCYRVGVLSLCVYNQPGAKALFSYFSYGTYHIEFSNTCMKH